MNEAEVLKVQGKYVEDDRSIWAAQLAHVGNVLDRAGHLEAVSPEEAVHLLRAYNHLNVRMIGGGTDLLRLLAHQYTPDLPDILINIKGITSLDYIEEANDILKIGALTRLSSLETSPLVKQRCAILAQTAACVASPQVRNMATIAGSICQDVSCWYYRTAGDYYHCLRKGGDICPALRGDNRWMFSIFGAAGGCYASCQSDMVVTLSLLNASIVTTERTIEAENFFIAGPPGHVLHGDEMITEIRVPLLPPGMRARYSKYSIRKSIDRPLASVACMTGERRVKVVVGGVFATPYIIEAKDDSLEKAGDVAGRAAEQARPMSMNAWKVEVMRALIARTLRDPA